MDIALEDCERRYRQSQQENADLRSQLARVTGKYRSLRRSVRANCVAWLDELDDDEDEEVTLAAVAAAGS